MKRYVEWKNSEQNHLTKDFDVRQTQIRMLISPYDGGIDQD